MMLRGFQELDMDKRRARALEPSGDDNEANVRNQWRVRKESLVVVRDKFASLSDSGKWKV